jgi:hypothetical protein
MNDRSKTTKDPGTMTSSYGVTLSQSSLKAMLS